MSTPVLEVYLDHAATSNPKPAVVSQAMLPYLTDCCANPGRGGHPLANGAARVIFEARENLLSLFHAPSKAELVFTANITESLNIALKGLLRAGDEVLVSSMEHNSMMRPLRQLEQTGVKITVIPCCPKTGLVAVDDIDAAISLSTKLVAINHGSNVFGTIQPITQIGKLCRQHGVLLLIDSAQTAGCIEINMAESGIDLLAFTGHKGLLGPMGIGGLIVGDAVNCQQLTPLITGGTGSLSEHELQPQFLPDALESGTPNLPGIAGLNAAVLWLKQQGVDVIAAREKALCRQLIAGLSAIDSLTIYASALTERIGVVSVRLEGVDCGELDEILIEKYGIYTRIGLHCSPSAHKSMGTFPEGTVRLSIGAFTTPEQIDYLITAFTEIAASK